jgi:uncharacterized protein
MTKNCEHEWERVDRSPEGMGISYYYYQCKNPQCSKVIYPMDQLQKLMEYSETHQFMFLEDWILALFYALPDSPISGRTSLQKQIFLLMMEFAQEEHIPTENIGFYGYDYGPYDDRIADAMDILVSDEFVTKTGKKNTSTEAFMLTFLGQKRAEQSFKKLTEDQRVKLIELRKEYQQWGKDGLIKYVYTYYPEYTNESKIRVKTLNLKKR